MIRRLAALTALLLASTPALAQQADEQAATRFCPNRPSLGASGCTTRPGEVQVELSGVDWQRDDNDETREDTLLYGDVIARFGITPHSEFQIGWTPLATVRTRDKASGAVTQRSGTGDVMLAWRRALSHPEGKELSSAIQPYVTLPVGRAGIGAGDWSAGVVLPVYWQVDERWSLDFTGQAAAAVDEDGDGRHFDASGVFGLGYAITEAVTATAEFSVERDNDPQGHVTRTLLAGSVAWQPTDRTQIDVLTVAGFNREAPDLRIVLGGAVLF
ncbi:MAG: transporter [Sphingomonas taxi]|uniref:Transporter n=1 Tax=Sphingomonas taxi TaxID=1549858 RepID=A0A2W5P730_9SPHN|nr:MAG: transporter [Sphingomonas taxi]